MRDSASRNQANGSTVFRLHIAMKRVLSVGVRKEGEPTYF
jgi:hypothetical protein